MRELASYAATSAGSRGRRHPESTTGHRSEYQRDRDRIIHSAAFRRLEYKTQVFVNHEGDLFRTRLTHSIEVAQIARTMARALSINEDLCEAISLAHDLGHTPFGHAGQDALNDCMKPYGGFEHNAQSLRVVDELEDKYAEFRGLNLMFDTREGILKHCSATRARQLGDVGERFLQRTQPSLEAQLANRADEIAYNNHDIDDGIRANLLSFEQLREVPLFRRHHDEVLERYGDILPKQQRHETIRRIINTLVTDLLDHSRTALQQAGVDSIAAVRALPHPLIDFSPQQRAENDTLKRFLREHLYQHHRVYRMMFKAKRVIRELFAGFMDDPRLLPPDFHASTQQQERDDPELGRARVVADYIAGMTDRFALDEYERLFDPRRLR
ncbi:deoxyguanosinetriphosphate triphosphohydrolase [Sinimarinibacterium sp. CAU 1509]|uniref:deoxyguanosinetriphosphate triphosphohydrolase n=1 Tax=Sinimarinibacterium sp. CAU 1509 TaxID=2562283 RepID=UPI0010ACD1DD|nr:deoxyguanosinetriphosphate triphosphohydrolase [Sinimarinibacterium sp. CAU 1509]TJY58331.1 deoxyguanosinetriphosphate triphosphohydrolase [Sinimarinibacterium sp. CAU 1509]